MGVKPVWTAEEIMSELGISISTAYRDIRILVEEGFLVQSGGARYMLGPAFIEYDRFLRKYDPLLNVAAPIMRELVEVTSEPVTSLLSRYYRDKVMCVHQESGSDLKGKFFISYERGRPMPLFKGATSQAILAFLPNRNMKRIYEEHSSDIKHAGLGGDWNEFKANLRQIRKDRSCVTKGEVDASFVGIAAPIFQVNDEVREVIGSISLVIKRGEDEDRRVAKLVPHVIGAAEEVSHVFSDD